MIIKFSNYLSTDSIQTPYVEIYEFLENDFEMISDEKSQCFLAFGSFCCFLWTPSFRNGLRGYVVLSILENAALHGAGTVIYNKDGEPGENEILSPDLANRRLPR